MIFSNKFSVTCIADKWNFIMSFYMGFGSVRSIEHFLIDVTFMCLDRFFLFLAMTFYVFVDTRLVFEYHSAFYALELLIWCNIKLNLMIFIFFWWWSRTFLHMPPTLHSVIKFLVTSNIRTATLLGIHNNDTCRYIFLSRNWFFQSSNQYFWRFVWKKTNVS